MTDLGFPLRGSTLVVGPSGAGKTRLTARALEVWIQREGTKGVVVVDLGPEFEHDGRILGRRLERFTDVPEGVWVGVVDANAPRAESETESELLELARENARAASACLAGAPEDPTAVFVNDVTIGYQHEAGELDSLLEYCDGAEAAVLNAFESDELGTDDDVSRRERDVVARLRDWADRIVELNAP